MIRSILLSLLLALPLQAGDFIFQGEVEVRIASPFGVSIPDATQYQIFDWDRSDGVRIRETGHGEATVTAPVGSHYISLKAYKLRIVDGLIKAETENFYSRFTVGTGGGTPPPTNPPTDPPTDPPTQPPVDPPDRPDGPDVTVVVGISRDSARSLNEPEQAKMLKAEIESWLTEANPSQGLERLKADGSAAVRTALRMYKVRNPTSRANWATGWRKPIDDWMKANVKTPNGYIKAMEAVAEGLGSVASAASANRIVMWTSPGCVECERWKKEMMPRFASAGFAVTIMPENESVRVYPTYVIDYNGQRKTLSDGTYLSGAVFNRLFPSKEN